MSIFSTILKWFGSKESSTEKETPKKGHGYAKLHVDALYRAFRNPWLTVRQSEFIDFFCANERPPSCKDVALLLYVVKPTNRHWSDLTITVYSLTEWLSNFRPQEMVKLVPDGNSFKPVLTFEVEGWILSILDLHQYLGECLYLRYWVPDNSPAGYKVYGTHLNQLCLKLLNQQAALRAVSQEGK